MNNNTSDPAYRPECEPGDLKSADNRTCMIPRSDSVLVVLILLWAGVVIVGSVIGNVLLVVVTICKPRLRDAADWLVLNMAVAHLILTSVIIPISIRKDLQGGYFLMGDAVCMFWLMTESILTSVTHYTLFLICLNILLYDMKVTCYTDRLSSRHAVIAIVVVWGLAFTEKLLLHSFTNTYVARPELGLCTWTWLATVSILAGPVLVLVVYSVAQSRQTRRRSLARRPSVPAGRNEYGDFSGIFHPDESKVVVMTGVIIGAFLLCWLPEYVAIIVFSLHPELRSRLLTTLSQWLSYTSTLVIPIVNLCCNWKYRFALQKVLCKGRQTTIVQVHVLSAKSPPRRNVGLTNIVRSLAVFARRIYRGKATSNKTTSPVPPPPTPTPISTPTVNPLQSSPTVGPVAFVTSEGPENQSSSVSPISAATEALTTQSSSSSKGEWWTEGTQTASDAWGEEMAVLAVEAEASENKQKATPVDNAGPGEQDTAPGPAKKKSIKTKQQRKRSESWGGKRSRHGNVKQTYA